MSVADFWFAFIECAYIAGLTVNEMRRDETRRNEEGEGRGPREWVRTIASFWSSLRLSADSVFISIVGGIDVCGIRINAPRAELLV